MTVKRYKHEEYWTQSKPQIRQFILGLSPHIENLIWNKNHQKSRGPQKWTFIKADNCQYFLKRLFSWKSLLKCKILCKDGYKHYRMMFHSVHTNSRKWHYIFHIQIRNVQQIPFKKITIFTEVKNVTIFTYNCTKTCHEPYWSSQNYVCVCINLMCLCSGWVWVSVYLAAI